MALFSDGPPSTIDDLAIQDSFLLGVASTEGIDVSSKITLAYNEVGIEILEIFGREASIYSPVLGQAPLDLNHLAITTALKLWHTFRALELTYRDCYFNQLNDRYKAKWAEYQLQALANKTRFINTGAALVIDPLPVPGDPVTTLQPASMGGGTLYLGVTLLNAAAEESSLSPVLESIVPDQQQLGVSVATWPANATGWNFYSGLSPVTLTLQNAGALTLGSSWEFTFPPAIGGHAPGSGQPGNVTRDLPRRIMRG